MTTTTPATTTPPPTAGPPAGSTTTTGAIDALLAAFEAGRPVDAVNLHPDVALDATLPNWRMHRQGPDAVAAQLASFFDLPGRFEEVRRQPIADGELVELTFAFDQDGVPHLVHEAHLLTLAPDGRIVGDTMFCGGRWSASLLAEMEAADA
jgi:hypothetical protein